MLRIEPFETDETTLRRDGAQCMRSAVSAAILRDIGAALADLPPDRAGVRIHGVAALQPLLAVSGPVGAVAASVLGDAYQPVRAILFDKTSAANWSLAWHQDRTITVTERIEVDGFGPWTVKGGLNHVEPPVELLAEMVTLRVHLDLVSTGNAPLLIAPGSHRFGRVAESEIKQVVRQCGTVACLADPGDVWIYATLILHASQPALEPAHRRVLQVDFAVGDLPGGLRWLGV